MTNEEKLPSKSGDFEKQGDVLSTWY
jgi:hypothetical protein